MEESNFKYGYESEIFKDILLQKTALELVDLSKDLYRKNKYINQIQDDRYKKINYLHEQIKDETNYNNKSFLNTKIIQIIEESKKLEVSIFNLKIDKFNKFKKLLNNNKNFKNEVIENKEVNPNNNEYLTYEYYFKILEKDIKIQKEKLDVLNTYEKKRLKIQQQYNDIIDAKKSKKEIEKIKKELKNKENDELLNIKETVGLKLNNLNQKIINQQRERKINQPKPIIKQNVIDTNIDIKNIDRLIEALKSGSKSNGTVATLSGFLGITTASIIARIIGNSTASYLSPRHKQNINIINNDDKKDMREKLINLLEQRREEDIEKIKKDIEHLEEQEKEKHNIKRKKYIKKKLYHRRNNTKINLVNVINRI